MSSHTEARRGIVGRSADQETVFLTRCADPTEQLATTALGRLLGQRRSSLSQIHFSLSAATPPRAALVQSGASPKNEVEELPETASLGVRPGVSPPGQRWHVRDQPRRSLAARRLIAGFTAVLRSC